MFLQKAQSNQRFLPILLNIVSKNVHSKCESVQAHKLIVPTLHQPDQVNVKTKSCRIKLTPLLTLGPVHIGYRQYATSEKPYKPLAKAKDLERVDPDDRYGGLDPSETVAGFGDSKQMEDANELVKKLFSLELANQRQIVEKQIEGLRKAVQLDPENENKYATLIVRQTVMIRSFSKRLLGYTHRKDVATKIKFMELVNKRRKILKILRKQNYAQFEKVKLVLGVEWIPAGKYDAFPKSRRQREKTAIIQEAMEKKKSALKEYMAERMEKQLLEVAQLKDELGMELTQHEQQLLLSSEETHEVKK